MDNDPGITNWYLSNNYAVDRFERGPEFPEFLLFHAWSTQPSIKGPAFGEGFLRNYPVNLTMIRTARNDWYQSSEMERIAELVRERIGKPLTGYGSSMSAYALLNFADWFDVRRGLIFAPQYSIDREKVPGEWRWRTEAEGISEFCVDRIAKADFRDRRFSMVYDPFSADGEHAKLIRTYARPHEIPLPFGGHTVADVLQRGGALKPLVLSILLDGADGIVERKVYRQARLCAQSYCAASAAMFTAGKYKLAERLARRAVELNDAKAPEIAEHYFNLMLMGVRRHIEFARTATKGQMNAAESERSIGRLRTLIDQMEKVAASWETQLAAPQKNVSHNT